MNTEPALHISLICGSSGGSMCFSSTAFQYMLSKKWCSQTVPALPRAPSPLCRILDKGLKITKHN